MKRTFWVATGFTLGVSSALHFQKRFRRAVERYTPEQARHDVTGSGKRVAARTRDLISDLREAAQQGSETMHQTEQDLRAEFAADNHARRHRPARMRQ